MMTITADRDVSWSDGRIRHRLGQCAASQNMSFMLDDDPRLDTPENTAMKPACKHCIRSMKVNANYLRQRAEQFQQLADEYKQKVACFIS